MLLNDLIKHKVYMEMQKNRIVKNSLTTLLSSINDFEDIIKFIQSKEYNNLPADIKKQIDLIIDNIFKNYNKEATTGIIEVAQYENIYNSKMIQNLIGTKIAIKNLSKDQINTFLNKDIIDIKFEKTLKKQTDTFKEIFKANIEIGIKDGLSINQISNNMRINLNQKKNHLETLTRTVFQNTMNLTSEDLYNRNKEFIQKLKRAAVLDGLTTDVCRRNNGKLYTIEESKGVLPAHYNCRSFFIPVIDKDFLIPARYKDFASTQKDDIFKSESDNKFQTSKILTLEEMKKREQ